MPIFPRSSLLSQALLTAPTKGKTILQHQHTGATAASVIQEKEEEEEKKQLAQELDALEKNQKDQEEEEAAKMLMLVKASGEKEAFVFLSIMKNGIKLPLEVSLLFPSHMFH